MNPIYSVIAIKVSSLSHLSAIKSANVSLNLNSFVVKNLYLVNNGVDGGKVCQKKVVLNGVEYESIAQCARNTGYTPTAISIMLRGIVKNSLGVRYAEV